ncbi:hypothetical protein BJV78DRAFT_1215547, partial [Lactifluus subvellereus]
MSGLAILAPLLFLSGIVVAQISAPDCTASGWQWTFNSLGQNPCLVAAYLLATCSGGTWNLLPLDPGSWYTVYVEFATLCNCNTVTYSLKAGLGSRSTAQKLCLFQLSQTLFLPEYVCPNGLSLMSQFVAQISSSTRTNNTSQLENNWNPK